MPPTDFVSRGQTLVASGQYQEAVRVCRLGLLGRPTEVHGRLVLAQALLALRRYDEVLAEMRVALELDGAMAAAHALKGEALLRKGDMLGAREALLRARQLAPGDPAIAALLAENEVAIANGGPRLPSHGGVADPETKHYPSHKGFGRPAEGPGSSSFTRPEVASSPDVATRAGKRAPPLAAPERTGTVEIDPEMSGVELVDDEDDSLGDVIDPPTGDDAEEMTEIDDADVIEARSRSRSGLEDASGERPTGIKAPDLGALFPDDETSSADLLARLPPGPPGASVHAAGPPMPLRPPARTGPSPLVPPKDPRPIVPERLVGRPGPTRPPPGPNASAAADMRTIRAGLGLDPDARLPKPIDRPPPAPAVDPTGIVISPPTGAPRGDESAILDSDRRLEAPRKNDRTRKVATDPGGNKLPRRPRRARWKIAVWGVVAALAIGGGVVGGFEIREMRLDRQVAAARREADGLARDDTWRGWRAARGVLEGVVRAQDRAGNRAALARARAVLAADFGDDPEGARAAVEALGDGSGVDAEIARAHLALLDGDAARLDAAVTALEALAPDAAETEYLAGRAALLAERWADAAAAFDRARAAGARPAYLIGLARAHAGRRAWPEARAAADLALSQHPEHPAVLIERARVLAEARAGGDAASAAASLEKLLAESEKPVEEQALGVSPRQAAWAALALAELHVMRGDPSAARRALDRARKEPPAEPAFSVGVIDVLLAIGDLAGARQEAEHAAKTWPSAAAVHVAGAQVALAEGDVARALTLLEPAGDLSSRPVALSLRGQARLAAGERDAARADLDAALALAPDLEPAMVARAELDLVAGEPREAVKRLERRYATGGSPELAITYAAALRGVGERDRARTVLAAVTGGNVAAPLAGRAWLETARIEREEGDARAARAAYAKAIELLPDATGARLESALLLVDTGDAAGARQSLDRLVEQQVAGKEDGRVLVEAARVHVLTGDLDGAKALLDRAETVPSTPRWLIARERGRLALRRRELGVAIEALERAAGLEPLDGETRLLLIDAHLGSGKIDAARRVLDDVMKRFNAMPEQQLAVGRVRLYSEAFDEAREAFVKAKDQLERSRAAPRWIADATYWLGLTTYYAGDPKRARALAAEALRSDPGLADAHALVGEIDSDRKQWRGAVKAYAKAVDLDPFNADAWYKLGEAALAARNRTLAKKAFAIYVERFPQGDDVAAAKASLAKL